MTSDRRAPDPALRGRPVVLAAAALVGAAGFVVLDALVGGQYRTAVFVALVAAAFGGVVALARAKAQRAHVAEQRARAAIAGREARDREAVAGQRARIAGELHDAVAHSVSVMVLQSGGVRRLLREDQQREREALEAIEETGRSVFAELRRVAGILAEDDAQAPREPHPTVERVGELVERARAAGLEVDLRVEGTPVPVSPGLGVSAYRIVQEALANALEHTGGKTVNVCVRYDQEDLCLDIVDDGRGAHINGNGNGHSEAPGHGLLGIRERVALYGGRLEAAPEPGGGFGVHARLPLKDA